MILFVPYNSPIAQMNCHQLIPFVAYINIATNIVLHNIKSNKRYYDASEECEWLKQRLFVNPSDSILGTYY